MPLVFEIYIQKTHTLLRFIVAEILPFLIFVLCVLSLLSCRNSKKSVFTGLQVMVFVLA